jgi:hypothetical protein
MAMGQTEWVQWPGNPIIEPGEPGSWDEGGRWVSNVIFDGSIYHIWFSGIGLDTNPTDIGHATSLDGVVWTMDPGNPCLTRGAPGEWDASGLLGVGAIYDDGTFHMWYSGGFPGIERAGYATSPDGSVWIKDPGNPVVDVGPPGSPDDQVVRPHTVLVEGGGLRMLYTCRMSTSQYSRICTAESLDGIVWTKHPQPVLQATQGWETGTCAPYVIADGSTYHMWYVGTQPPNFLGGSIGYACSGDGIHWYRYPGNPVLARPAEESFFASPVLLEGLTYLMWHDQWNGVFDRTSYATSTCCNAGLFADDFETGDTSAWSVTVPWAGIPGPFDSRPGTRPSAGTLAQGDKGDSRARLTPSPARLLD